MNAVLALVFFACVAGSMAAPNPAIGQVIQQGQALAQAALAQGQALAQATLTQLQVTIMGLVQQALGQLSSLAGSIGGRIDLGLDAILAQVQALLQGLAGQALGQLLGGLNQMIGGRAAIDIASIFSEFFQGIQGSITGIGQHLLNQGLASVLGGLGSLGGSRAVGDMMSSLSAQIAAAIAAAQGALTGAWSGLQQMGGNVMDASKPHWTSLQEQLVGHGLNVLGSLSETINNVHGSITGGR